MRCRSCSARRGARARARSRRTTRPGRASSVVDAIARSRRASTRPSPTVERVGVIGAAARRCRRASSSSARPSTPRRTRTYLYRMLRDADARRSTSCSRWRPDGCRDRRRGRRPAAARRRGRPRERAADRRVRLRARRASPCCGRSSTSCPTSASCTSATPAGSRTGRSRATRCSTYALEITDVLARARREGARGGVQQRRRRRARRAAGAARHPGGRRDRAGAARRGPRHPLAGGSG